MANTLLKYDVEASLKVRMVVETTETDRRAVRPIAREIVQTLIDKYQAVDGEELDTRVTEWSLDVYDNFADAHLMTDDEPIDNVGLNDALAPEWPIELKPGHALRGNA